jgi:hypothetical protein
VSFSGTARPPLGFLHVSLVFRETVAPAVAESMLAAHRVSALECSCVRSLLPLFLRNRAVQCRAPRAELTGPDNGGNAF